MRIPFPSPVLAVHLLTDDEIAAVKALLDAAEMARDCLRDPKSCVLSMDALADVLDVAITTARPGVSR